MLIWEVCIWVCLQPRPQRQIKCWPKVAARYLTQSHRRACKYEQTPKSRFRSTFHPFPSQKDRKSCCFCLSCLKNRNSEFTVIKLHFMSFVLKFDKPKQLLFSRLIQKVVQCFHRVEDLSNRVILIDEVLIEQV